MLTNSNAAVVQAVDGRALFLFMGDLNGHHQEWLGSTTMNRHGVVALDFATVSHCVQMVIGPTHIGATLDLQMTVVPDLVWVAIVAPLFFIIIIRKGRQCKAERERLTPYQSEDTNL